MRFNLGDKVKVTHVAPPSTVKAVTDKIGHEGTVTEIYKGKIFSEDAFYVLFADETKLFFFEDELELVK